MLHWLKPRDGRMFERFGALTGVLEKSGDELRRVPASFPDKIEESAERMRKLENEADDLTHAIIDEINASFITPFDREDLYLLAHRIDDVIDFSENAVSNLVTFGITECRPPLKDFCETVAKVTTEIRGAVEGLRDLRFPQHIAERNLRIHTLESEGDELLKAGLADLFAKEKDAREIIKWRDIFQSFERSLDRAEDVANIIEGIVIKHS